MNIKKINIPKLWRQFVYWHNTQEMLFQERHVNKDGADKAVFIIMCTGWISLLIAIFGLMGGR